jgi:protein-S-isoprenylcysteine O-methyltransferase Ste14
MVVTSRISLAVTIVAVAGLAYKDSILATGAMTIAVQIVAVLLMLWARLTFGRRSFHASADPTDGGLMTSGPYRYTRHPIYASVLYFVWAGVLCHLSLFGVLVGTVATIGLVLRILAEERLVAERYPEYASYAMSTKRIIPFIL